MKTLIHKLYRIGFLSPKGAYQLAQAWRHHGSNLMALLYFAAHSYPERQMLNADITYAQGYQIAMSLAYRLHNFYGIGHYHSNHDTHRAHQKPQRIALLIHNCPTSIFTLFAVSRLGADITLLNPDMSHEQIQHIINSQAFDGLIYDPVIYNPSLLSQQSHNTANSPPVPLVISLSDINDYLQSITLPQKNKNNFEGHTYAPSLPRKRMNQLNVLTGGTSGKVKIAKRQSNPLTMLLPFFALLKKLSLDKYHSVYITAPIYHGYGLASLIMSVALGGNIFVSTKFDSKKALELINNEHIEVLIAVPTVIKRLMNEVESSDKQLRSIKRILSGGARLDEHIIDSVQKNIGDVLFNLYGTSEAGFCIMATPDDLRKYPDSIGKPIRGVKLILDSFSSEIHLTTAWSMSNKITQQVATGDIGEVNDEGYVFLKGRIDDMIVSGGENVYPYDVERIINSHPQVKQVAAIAVESTDFGKRLIAFVVLNGLTQNDNALDADGLKYWLKSKLARYQMPERIIMLDEMPMTSTGKVSKAQMVKMYRC